MLQQLRIYSSPCQTVVVVVLVLVVLVGAGQHLLPGLPQMLSEAPNSQNASGQQEELPFLSGSGWRWRKELWLLLLLSIAPVSPHPACPPPSSPPRVPLLSVLITSPPPDMLKPAGGTNYPGCTRAALDQD